LFYIGHNCQIHPSVQINVLEGCIGAGSIIREGAVIEGKLVEIGREAVIGRRAYIGGGSAFSERAYLKAGDWLHMGIDSHINTAMGVKVGHSFGLGMGSKIFTHGAYLDAFNLGAPTQWASVSIGNNVWLPNAWVNPGVKIGDNVIVAALSLINKDIPSGSLAGGIPATVLKEKYLPKALTGEQESALIKMIESQCKTRPDLDGEFSFSYNQNLLSISEGNTVTMFDLKNLTIKGRVSTASVSVKDQLRRNGIRFRYEPVDGVWTSWKS
jgi:acetyltransferase-like isoleucine patch superfamily enzyme